MKRKAMGDGLRWIVVLVLVTAVIALAAYLIPSQMGAAGEAAKSCPAWLSSVRDVAEMKYICGG